jgi:putative membrane protein
VSRSIALALGLVALAAAWLLPLGELLGGAFSAHMAKHMGVVAIAAPLLALGLAAGPLDPVRYRPGLFPPIPISLIELVVVWTWHAPALHHAAQHSIALLALEQASFLISGLLMWLAAFGGGPALRAQRRGAGVVALLLTSMHMTLLGALLALPTRALYAHAEQALDDQHMGGAIMLIVGGIAYLAGGLWLSAELLRRSERPAPVRGRP